MLIKKHAENKVSQTNLNPYRVGWQVCLSNRLGLLSELCPALAGVAARLGLLVHRPADLLPRLADLPFGKTSLSLQLLLHLHQNS